MIELVFENPPKESSKLILLSDCNDTLRKNTVKKDCSIYWGKISSIHYCSSPTIFLNIDCYITLEISNLQTLHQLFAKSLSRKIESNNRNLKNATYSMKVLSRKLPPTPSTLVLLNSLFLLFRKLFRWIPLNLWRQFAREGFNRCCDYY